MIDFYYLTGKSSIVRRFLSKTYTDKYKPTVEDLHTREFDIGSTLTLKVRLLHNLHEIKSANMPIERALLDQFTVIKFYLDFNGFCNRFVLQKLKSEILWNRF